MRRITGISSFGRFAAGGLCLALSWPAIAAGADIYAQGAWSALASDRAADRVGDTLTIVIYENSAASNSAQNGTSKTSRLGGQISAGSSFNEAAQLNLNGGFEGSSQTGRVGKMMAQISVSVVEVLPNGDLRVAGEQVLNVNGDRTRIKLKGRVRRADISGNNTVLSTRLAEAAIDYDGTGFVSRGARPGIVSRIFNWLGLT